MNRLKIGEHGGTIAINDFVSVCCSPTKQNCYTYFIV
jgi:hypothetical protein